MRLDSSRLLRVLSSLPLSRLSVAAVSLMLAYVAVLIVFGHSHLIGVLTDCLTVACVLFAAVACSSTGHRSRGIARPFWYLAAATFATWFLGRCLLFYDQYHLGIAGIRIVPLLLFFLSGVPWFVAVFLSDDDFSGTFNWEWILDALHILGLGAIIYLFFVHFAPFHLETQATNLVEDHLLLWRNIVVATGLLARAVFTHSRSVRRLYLPVALVMSVFAGSTWVANRAQSLTNASPWYDLAWAIPFCLVALVATLWRDSPEENKAQRPSPNFSRVVLVYLPSLALPVMLLVKYRSVVREQIFLALFGLMFSIVLFNARLFSTLRRQRKTTEALRASEQQYHSLFERTMAGVFRGTLDGKILDCNAAFANMVGYAREELRGLSMGRLYFGGEEECRQWILNLWRGAQPMPCETRLRRKDGSSIWVIQNANLEKQADGGGVLESTLLDITERKLADQVVEDWKRRYDAAVLASGQIIYEWELGSDRVTLGGCVREILGYSAEELSGAPGGWHALIHADDAAHYEEKFRVVQTAREPIDFEFRARRRDHGYRTLRQQGRAVLDASGRAVRLVGFISDVTEQRVLEAQFRQAQKMEAIGRLAGGVAHDFNNLLTVISGYSTMQLARTDPSSQAYHELRQIEAAANRAAALTRQLLAFSRQQVLQPQPVNLNDLVRNLDRMLRRLIGEDIEVLTVLAPDLGTVRVDPGQVDQVLMNLAVNARDAMPGGGKLTIQTENIVLDTEYVREHGYVNPGYYVLLAVSDSGMGMDPETQARIFEPFFTTKEAGKGTGLGMSMVYGTVKQSGGHIEVYSELNRGTTVKIYLPRVDTQASEVQPTVGRPEFVGGSERILLIEDDVQLRRMVAEILTARGYDVQVIENIEQLDAVLQRIAKCDLLLTDVVMPQASGTEVAKYLVQKWPGIKVLYMSGYATDAIVNHGVLKQGFFFLQKPFTPAALAAKVREVLDASRS